MTLELNAEVDWARRVCAKELGRQLTPDELRQLRLVMRDQPLPGFVEVAAQVQRDERTLRRAHRQHDFVRQQFDKIGGRYFLHPGNLLNLCTFFNLQRTGRGERSARTAARQSRVRGRFAKKRTRR